MADGQNLATYSFLPWLRQGIAAKIQEIDLFEAATPPVERASLDVTATVVVDDEPGETVARVVQIAGPGDVIGINPRAVVRTEPLEHITNFEPNFLPFIEFYDEDFPWRYTPASAAEGSRL